MTDEPADKPLNPRVHEIWKLKKQLLNLIAQYPPDVAVTALADTVAFQIVSMRPKPPFSLTKEQVQQMALEQHVKTVLSMMSANEQLVAALAKIPGSTH